MVLRQKGLLSDCEQMFTPMSSDEEGHLRGGFGGISVLSNDKEAPNKLCKNTYCRNYDCTNIVCGNGNCTNTGCDNTDCYVLGITTESSETTTPRPIGGPILFGFL